MLKKLQDMLNDPEGGKTGFDLRFLENSLIQLLKYVTVFAFILLFKVQRHYEIFLCVCGK